jgi:hypothetical protein
MNRLIKTLLGASGMAAMLAGSAFAQDAAPAAPAAPAAAPVPMPAMTGPLANNPAPYSVDLSGSGFDWMLGKVYLSGVITGGVVGENHVAPGDKNTNVDLFNGMAVAQKTDGWFQWYVQAGAYATPTLGTAYTSSSNNTTGTFSSVPQGYVKLVPTDTISFEGGKLPTLIGAEYEFTYENMNVERGLMWAQEPAVSRGAQANYASGPFSASIALTDGYYSDRYNVLSGMMSYGFNGGADTVALVGSGNLGHTFYGRAGASLFQNNSSIFNAIYTHTSGNWTITPYFQYATGNSFPGSTAATTTSTSGAILASYALNDFWHLAGRFEYVSTSGPTNILYGPNSNAMTFTITPTWQYKVLFVRPEFSYVTATTVTPGSGLGPTGGNTDQFRGVLEAGIMF